jgi:hypothetical protein
LNRSTTTDPINFRLVFLAFLLDAVLCTKLSETIGEIAPSLSFVEAIDLLAENNGNGAV